MEREKPKSKEIVTSQVQPISSDSLPQANMLFFGIFNVGHVIQENQRMIKQEEQRRKNQQ